VLGPAIVDIGDITLHDDAVPVQAGTWVKLSHVGRSVEKTIESQPSDTSPQTRA